jgi:hypothetical protein
VLEASHMQDMSERDEEEEEVQDDDVEAHTTTYAQTHTNMPQIQQINGNDLHLMSISDC